MELLLNTSDGPAPSSNDSKTLNAITWDWFSIVQLNLALVGILGNVLVITVYLKKLRVRSNSNKLIALLAVADLLTSIAVIPLPTMSVVPLTAGGRVYCKLVHSRVIMWISIVASVFTLTLLSLERFFAVVYPLKHKTVFSNSHMKYFIATVWMSATILNVGSFYIPDVGEENSCVLKWPNSTYQAFHGMTLFIFEFVIPVVVMVVSHYFAVKGLKKQAKSLLERNTSTTSPAFSLLQSRRRVIRMVLIVVVTFIICWGPDQIGFLVLNLGGLAPDYFTSLTYRSFAVLAFLNSCVNPVIYISLNKNFRVAMGQLLPCIKRKVGNISETTGTLHMADSGQGASSMPPHPKPQPNFPNEQPQRHHSSEICVESCS